MTQRGPTFIIAGAPRSGTTWLYHLLDRHPEVYMAKPARPEPKFFLIDELYARGFDYYVDTWFRDTGSAIASGEKTTNYLESPDAAARIHAHLPQVRLIFIMREPASRAYSNWAWSRMNGMEKEEFEVALALEDERERTLAPALRYARPHAYFSRGLYAPLLRRFFAHFPGEQLLCLNFEGIIRDASALASRLHDFIGVSRRPDDARGLDIVNPSELVGQMPATAWRQLQDRYSESNGELVQMLGDEFKWETR